MVQEAVSYQLPEILSSVLVVCSANTAWCVDFDAACRDAAYPYHYITTISMLYRHCITAASHAIHFVLTEILTPLMFLYLEKYRRSVVDNASPLRPHCDTTVKVRCDTGSAAGWWEGASEGRCEGYM